MVVLTTGLRYTACVVRDSGCGRFPYAAHILPHTAVYHRPYAPHAATPRRTCCVPVRSPLPGCTLPGAVGRSLRLDGSHASGSSSSHDLRVFTTYTRVVATRTTYTPLKTHHTAFSRWHALCPAIYTATLDGSPPYTTGYRLPRYRIAAWCASARLCPTLALQANPERHRAVDGKPAGYAPRLPAVTPLHH